MLHILLLRKVVSRYHEAALTTDDAGRLRHVSSMQKVVVGIIELTVSEL